MSTDNHTTKSGIYQIKCIANDKVYRGSAINIIARWRHHRTSLSKNKHHCRHLQYAWTKYGPETFEWSVLEYVDDPKNLIEREQHHLDTCTFELFNSSPTAGSSLGVKHTDEMRAKVSFVTRNRSPETLAKLATAGRNHSPEHKAKLLAISCSPEHRAKLLAVNLGKTNSPEARAKIAAANRNRTHSPETRAKMAAAKLGIPRSPDTRAKIGATQRGKTKRHKSLPKQMHFTWFNPLE